MSDPEDSFARDLRGFGPVGWLAILVALGGGLLGGWAGAALVLLWAYRSHTPWAEIGLSPPASWALTVPAGILFGAVFKVIQKSLVLPLFGASPINHAYQFLVGNAAALPGLILYILVSAAVGEEIFYRGYLFERLGKLLGKSLAAKIAIIVIAAFLFGLAHVADQGRDGAIQAVIVALVFGAIYTVTRRLWFLMVAHAAFDLTAVAIIYLGLETRVAHLFLR